jgi:hypothetical protein
VLEAAVAAGGARSELVPEIRRIATRYGIVTKFTAGLVLEPGDRPDTNETDVHDTDIEIGEVTVDRPFTGPSTNSSIGLGGGAGGGRLARRVKGRSASESVDKGLRWLASLQQDSDGRIGTLRDTAEALLAFLGAGYTDRGSERDNPYSRAVRGGLRALMNAQAEDGRIGDDLRTHIRATLAMCEAYWMTRNPRYKKPAQRALDYLARVRASYSGWPREKPDTLTTAEAVLALKSGKFAGRDVDPDAFAGARRWFGTKGAITSPVERDAVLFVRALLGERIGSYPNNEAARRTMAGLEWAALAEFQVTGRFEAAAAVAEAQQVDGSWGSVADTAAAVRILVTQSRYERVVK